ncbi:MAG: hypothetical protein U0Q21_07910 [Dermatophilaceae bacterium]
MSIASQPAVRGERMSTGAKITTLLAVLLLLVAAYSYFVPINIPAQQGVFGCGSAFHPPKDDFAKGICQDLASINRFRSLMCLIAAILLGGLGWMFFDGAPRAARVVEDDDEAAESPRDPGALDD